MVITAGTTYYQVLNEQIRACADTEITINEVYGDRKSTRLNSSH